MKNVALWGLVGGVVLGSVALPAQAQLGDLKKAASDAAGKLASKITGKEVSATTSVAALPNASTEKSARVTFLDKQTNRRQVLVLVAGEVQAVGALQVRLTKCLPDYAAVLGQDVAWLDVTEGPNGSGRAAPWFSGWMFNTYPEVSTLDHPRYDVQLQGCGVKARQVLKASGSAPVLDTAPVVDTESSNDTPTDTSDPYYVPGVGKPAEPAAPVAAPVEPAAPAAPADTEAPAEPAAPISDEVHEDQGDLHRMMDSGTY